MKAHTCNKSERKKVKGLYLREKYQEPKTPNREEIMKMGNRPPSGMTHTEQRESELNMESLRDEWEEEDRLKKEKTKKKK